MEISPAAETVCRDTRVPCREKKHPSLLLRDTSCALKSLVTWYSFGAEGGLDGCHSAQTMSNTSSKLLTTQTTPANMSDVPKHQTLRLFKFSSVSLAVFRDYREEMLFQGKDWFFVFCSGKTEQIQHR